jgi:hypothetical protein
MAYNHMTVAHLETKHAAVKVWAAQRDGLYPDEKVFDGIPMRGKLADLCEAVRKHYKDIAFICDGNATSYYNHGHTARKVDAIWAYFPGDTYALVRMSYEPAGNDGTSAYHITARTVANAKYATHNQQYHTVTTTDLAKATKHVKTYLQPYTMGEMGMLSFVDFRGKLVTDKSKADDAVLGTRLKVVQHKGFDAELENMVNSDYKFVNSELRNNVIAYLNAKREEKERKHGRINAAYVHVRMVGEQQMFDVTKLRGDVTDSYHFYPSVREKMVTYDSETLPETIMSKLAVLSMLERGGYLADTGMKDSDTAFWVQI